MSIALRQKLIVIAVVTAILTVFTLMVTVILKAPIDVGVTIGALMGVSIGCFEEFYVQRRAGAWMRRMRPVYAIAIYAGILCVIFIFVQHFAYYVTGNSDALAVARTRYHISLPILFAASAFAILTLRVVGFIGAANLLSLLIGRYMRPRMERKVMLFLDIRNSTRSVEILGPVRAKAYIGKFLFDISRPITDHGGDIYLYTGDGLVAIWDWDVAIANNTIVSAVSAIGDAVDFERKIYERDFGMIPEFRIGVHGGDVVVSEQGDTKKAIGVYGDAINIAARMEQSAKKLGVNCVFSAEIINNLPVKPSEISDATSISVAGISDPILVHSVELLDFDKSK